MSKLSKILFVVNLFSLLCLRSLLKAQEYRQQHIDYTIRVKLDDKNHTLSGFEKITYYNNSEQTIREMYFHLWPNAYKNLNTALAKQLLEAGETDFYWSKPEERGYIDSLAFKVNGKPVPHTLLKDTIDVCKIILPVPLEPGGRAEIETPFFVKIPSAKFSRLGHIGQQYQITQWYPKPAVFENGRWKYMPYLNQGEFYSDFATFNVYITLPRNYVVGATGDLVENEEELKWLNDKAEATKKIEVFPNDMSFPPSDTSFKTLHYCQENVHDFAWFADKRYHVLKGEVELPHSKRKVTTWALFTNSQAKNWINSIKYINDALFYYSLWNGDYPYEQCTAVDGTISAGGGMEYPNITVIGETPSPNSLELVIVHEVGHNWFYGILGTNEREYAWMDEGINSFYEMRYMTTKYPDSEARIKISNFSVGNWFELGQINHSSRYYWGYYLSKVYNLAQPPQTHSALFSEINYGTIVYMKTAALFNYLRNYLGDETFDKAMQTYFETWKFKHPKPKDLQEILEKVSGKNLNWFFDDLIKTDKTIDYKIVNGGTNDNGNFVKIKNVGQVACPVLISGLINGKERASIWYDGFKGEQWLAFPQGKFDVFKIDHPGVIPEINRRNNTLNNQRLFRRIEPIRLQWLGALDNPNKTQLFYTPVLGWNENNGFMAGIALYNHILPSKKIELTAMPMYGFKNKRIAGFGSLYALFKPSKFFTTIRLGGEVKSYSYFNNLNSSFPYDYNYVRIAPTAILDFKNKNYRSKIEQILKIRTLLIAEDYSKIIRTDKNSVAGIIPRKWSSTILDISHSFKNNRSINPFQLFAHHAQSNRFARTTITFNYVFTYPKRNLGLELRVFAGKMWYAHNYDYTVDGIAPYSSSSYGLSMDGNNDFTYDQILLDRSKTGIIFSKQLFVNDGGFKNPTNQALNYNWLGAINLFAPIPRIFMAAYTDVGISSTTNGLIFNSGVAIVPLKNILHVYIPIYQNYKLNQLNFVERIRFTLQLNNLNPFELKKNLLRLI